MQRSSGWFEVVLLTSSVNEPIVVRSTADPNTATVAFHEEFQRLMRQGATGELLVMSEHEARNPILRLPLQQL